MRKLTLFNSLTRQLEKKRQTQQLQAKEQKSFIGAHNHFKHRILLKKLCWKQTRRSLAVFAIAVISLTAILGPRFYNQPLLDVGTTAPETIKAPATAQVEDIEATEANRQAVRKAPPPVITVDLAVNRRVIHQLQVTLIQGGKLRQVAGAFPFTSTSILSNSTQAFLRKCSDSQWQELLATVGRKKNTRHKKVIQPNSPSPVRENEAMVQAAIELKAYRSTATPQKFSSLIATISRSRQQYASALNSLANLQAAKPPTLYESSLLELTNANWEKTAAGIRTSAERILTQGIAPGLQPRILQEAVNLQVRSLVPEATEPLATEMLLNFLKPNLKRDEAQMRRQAEQAAAAVEPVVIGVSKGEIVVSEGELISQEDFVLLDYFGLSRRQMRWRGLAWLSLIVIAAIGVFELVARQFYRKKLRQRDCLLVLLLALSTPLLIHLNLPYTNLPAIGLLLSSFYGFPLSGTVVGLITLLLPVGLDVSWKYLLTGAAGGIVSSWIAGRMRSREEIALLGIGVGLTQGLLYLLGGAILKTTSGSSWYDLAWAALLCGLSGLAWSIVALGLSPYLEHLFDLVTPIRLVELANPNRPLLQRLATQAPGTFQHTLLVATLAEAAAKELKCNVELVRTGTLYHDIGKLHFPLAFIENQMCGSNIHDEINDPWQSAEIIKKHVTEGLVMARKYRLPTAVQAFIPEHQGSMLIAYFYHQAQQLTQQDPSISIQESDFRYDGPTPQSRETAIVMLADSCEAALRSLPTAAKPVHKEPTPEEALVMVNKILRSRWQEKQLVDSGLTRDEMSKVAEIFVEVWQQFHHKRIAYPKLGVREKGK